MSERSRAPSEPVFRLRGEVEGKLRSFTLEDGDNTVGSIADARVCLQAEGVSRRHAVLRVSPTGIEVEDLDSKNGVFVNSRKVSRARIKDGDSIHFGPVALSLEAITPDELEMAIDLGSEIASNDDDARADDRPSTMPGRGPDGTAAWAGLLNDLIGLLFSGQPPDLTAAAQAIAAGTAVDGAALLQRRADGNALVRAASGELPDDDLGTTIEHTLQRLSAHGSQRSGLGSTVIAGEPAMAVALELVQGQWRHALLTWGGTRIGRLCPILESCLRLVVNADERRVVQDRRARPAHRPELVIPGGHVIGTSAAMAKVYDQLRGLVSGDIPVLITGETGVGKEHVARILHASSPRADGPFQVLNCAAIPSDLLEAELFGIEAGVATGVSRRQGKLQLASGGVIFFDEIGDMAPSLQAKVLRALQEREVHPLGAGQPVPVDVRVLAATNTDLEASMASGAFRRDLYYRIAGCTVHLPPLRERREDIPALVEHFLDRFTAETGKSIRGISVRTLRALQQAPWCGNVRELEHEVRRLVYLCPEGEAIESDMVASGILSARAGDKAAAPPLPGDLDLQSNLEELERRLIREAIARAGGNLAAAARLLGVTRNGLVMKIERLGIDR